MRNRSVVPIGLLLVSAVLASKEGGSGGGAAAPAGGNVVKIGAALSLTGAAQSYGAQQRAGIEAALDALKASNSLGGVRLEAVIEDDGSTKEQGINVFQKFINQDKVSVILGPTLSTTATAADPLAQQAKVPVLAVSNTAPSGITDIGDYIFRDSLTEAQVIPGAVKKAKAKLGFKTAGMLYGNDDVFTKAGYDVMKKALDDEGVQIIETQTFAKPDRDFSAQITSLKGKNP
ncbi:MAG: ABC transporter substrate-binding protein, partial [Myxococcales bacterium]